jgi:hypothetical protein
MDGYLPYVNVKPRKKEPPKFQPHSHHARARQQVSRILHQSPKKPKKPKSSQCPLPTAHASSSDPIFLDHSASFPPPRPNQRQASIQRLLLLQVPCVGNANCLIFSAHIFSLGRAVSVLHPASSLLPYVLSHLRLSHSPAHCIAAARCESRINQPPQQLTPHPSHLPFIRICAVLYNWKGARVAAGEAHFHPLTARRKTRRPRKTLRIIAKSTIIASNIPVHAQALPPFRSATDVFCSAPETTNKRLGNTIRSRPGAAWRTAAKDPDGVALLGQNRARAAIPE